MPSENSSLPLSFVTKYSPISFSFPPGWFQNEEVHPFDLQILSQFETMNTGVFVFKSCDLAEDSDPYDIFLTQINDMASKRKNFKQFEAIEKIEYSDKKVATITFTGEMDYLKYCYRFSLIEFLTDKSCFAVVLQVATPGEWEESKPILETIIGSAKTVIGD